MVRPKAHNKIVSLVSRVREKSNAFLQQELARNGLEGLVPSHGDILLALHLSDKLSMKQVAEFVNKKKSTVTILVNKLIVLGYVKKTKDLHDNRFYFLSLTKKGKALDSPIADISKRLNAKIAENISKEERDQLAKILGKINANW